MVESDQYTQDDTIFIRVEISDVEPSGAGDGTTSNADA